MGFSSIFPEFRTCTLVLTEWLEWWLLSLCGSSERPKEEGSPKRTRERFSHATKQRKWESSSLKKIARVNQITRTANQHPTILMTILRLGKIISTQVMPHNNTLRYTANPKREKSLHEIIDNPTSLKNRLIKKTSN